MQAQTVASNTEVAVCGAPVGEAFVADATGAGAFDKLSRYEKPLMLHQGSLGFAGTTGSRPLG